MKKVLIGMAAGAFGMAMVGCGGDVETVDEGGADEVTEGGEASCAGALDSDTEADVGVDAEGDEGAEGGEASCGAGSCGG
jgi:hypothetical protein